MNRAAWTRGACIAIALGLGGCTAHNQAGESRYVFVSGELKDTEIVTLDRAWEATLAAMDELEYAVGEKRKEATDATVTAAQPDGTRVRVALKGLEPERVQFKVHIGALGNERQSRLVMETIRSKL